MPRNIVVGVHDVTEGNDVILTNYLVAADGTPVVQGDVTGNLSVRVFDISGGGEGRDQDRSIFTDTAIAVATGGLGASGGHIEDTLETVYWDGKDQTGYNFVYALRWDSASSTGPYLRGGHRYKVEFEATLTGGTDFGVMRWFHILNVGTGAAV